MPALAVLCAIVAVAFALPLFAGGTSPWGAPAGKTAPAGIGVDREALVGDESVPDFSAPDLGVMDEALEQAAIDAASAPQPGSGADGAGGSDAQAAPEDFDVPDLADVPHVAGEVLVGLEEGVSVDEALAAIAERTGIEVVSATAVADDCMQLVLPEGVSVEEALAMLPATGVVADAQPNYVYQLMDEGAPLAAVPAEDFEALVAQSAVPNDPYAKKGDQWALESIGAFEAWDIVKSNRKVTVAVVDGGFNVAHEDLKNNVVGAYNAVTGTSKVSGLADHGTHVAGIVAAEANNAKGVAGVSYNARIMPVKVADGDGDITTAAIVSAYDYIIKNRKAYNVRVINMSIGTARDSTAVTADDRRAYSKIDQAHEAGIVTVCAACNAGTYNGKSYSAPFYAFPTDYDKVVSVINLQDDGNGKVSRYPWSNYNKPGQRAKDISAPGTDIMSTYVPNANSYATWGGTSMAAPHVAGVLALVFAEDPSLTPDQAVSKVCSTATDVGAAGWDAETGYGEVNAYGAVGEQATYLTGASAVAKGASASYSVNAGGTWSWSSSSKSIATVSSSGKLSAVDAGTVTVSAKNARGQKAVATVSVYDPTISGSSTLEIGSSTTFKLKNSKNPAGVWKWTSSNPSVATVSSGTGVVTGKSAGTATITVSLAAAPSIKASFKLTVSRIGIAGASVTGVKNMPYTGKQVTLPDLAVKLGSTTLERGKDYTVAYKDNVKAGTASVTVTGKGNYTGTRTVKFKIVPVKASVSYQAHVQGIGWQSWAKDGASAGTTGESKRLEALRLKLTGLSGTTGDITYRAHVQGIGWQSWVSNGSMAGTTGLSKRLEGIQIKLTGDAARHFDVYYRAHVQHFGWMGWAKNGAMAGSAGYSYRLEALQVKLVPKNAKAPGSTSGAFRQKGK